MTYNVLPHNLQMSPVSLLHEKEMEAQRER